MIFSFLFLLISQFSNASCCCVEQINAQAQGGFVGWRGFAHIDDELGWGHKFIVELTVTKQPGPGGMCRVQWMERTDFVAPAMRGLGIVPGVWQDHLRNNPSSEVFLDFYQKQYGFASGVWRDSMRTAIRFKDPPAIPYKDVVFGSDGVKRYNRYVRNLEINVRATSTCSVCPKRSLNTSIYQYLSVKGGRPEAANFCITNPGYRSQCYRN